MVVFVAEGGILRGGDQGYVNVEVGRLN
jgi:hypothetical protein